MGKPSAPTPPDPKQTSAAQTGTNVATAVANTAMGNVNQYGPNGSLTYDQTGTTQFTDPFTNKSYDIPQYSATTSLSPDQQAIYDQNQGAQLGMASTANIAGQNLQDVLGQQFSPQGLPQRGNVPNQSNLIDRKIWGGPIQREIADAGGIVRSIENPDVINRDAEGGEITRSYGADDFSDDRQRVEQAIMGRMQPSIDQDRERMQTQLANQGIGVGSRAYSASQGDFSQGVNDARLGAILAGGQEQSRMVGMDRDRAGFQNAAQNQAFGQDLANIGQRNAAIGQQFGQNLSAAQFANSAQGQQFGQNATQAQFGNMAQQQKFDQGLANVTQRNATRQQQFGQGMDRFNAQNAQRAGSLSEQFAMRNQPINEIAALLSGSQVSMPNFQMNQPSRMPTTDNAGLINAEYGQRLNNFNNQQAQRQQLLGGLFDAAGNLGSAAITGGMFS